MIAIMWPDGRLELKGGQWIWTWWVIRDDWRAPLFIFWDRFKRTLQLIKVTIIRAACIWELGRNEEGTVYTWRSIHVLDWIAKKIERRKGERKMVSYRKSIVKHGTVVLIDEKTGDRYTGEAFFDVWARQEININQLGDTALGPTSWGVEINGDGPLFKNDKEIGKDANAAIKVPG